MYLLVTWSVAVPLLDFSMEGLKAFFDRMTLAIAIMNLQNRIIKSSVTKLRNDSVEMSYSTLQRSTS